MNSEFTYIGIYKDVAILSSLFPRVWDRDMPEKAKRTEKFRSSPFFLIQTDMEEEAFQTNHAPTFETRAEQQHYAIERFSSFTKHRQPRERTLFML